MTSLYLNEPTTNDEIFDLKKMEEEKSAINMYHRRIDTCVKAIQLLQARGIRQGVIFQLGMMRKLQLENPTAHLAYIEYHHKALVLQFPNWNITQ
jgi:hypothetical protein